MTDYSYYIYAYLRKSDLTIYYIGKGKKDRKFQKHSVKVPVDKNRIVVMETNLSDIGACALERRYIRWYGRKDIGTGILRNLTNGGEGTSGRKSTPESIRKRIQTMKRNGTLHFSPEARLRSIQTRREKGNLIPSEASKQKNRESQIIRFNEGRMDLSHTQFMWTCEYCSKTGQGLGAYTKWHGFNCDVINPETKLVKTQLKPPVGNGQLNGRAKTWRITSPTGDVYVCKGQLDDLINKLGLGKAMLKKYISQPVPIVSHARHPVSLKTIGWKLEIIK